MSRKRRRFKVCPELSDGSATCIVDDPQIVGDAVVDWLCEAIISGGHGESITVELVEMTDEEVEALPEL